MVRETFENDLRRLQDEILVLGSMVEQAILESVAALGERDKDESRRLIEFDRTINRKRFAIEDDALLLVATQQPVAGDLRVIAAVLAIAGELERIGDYAKGIAKINILMGDGPLIKPLIDIPRMAQTARDMLHSSLEAFVERDVELAQQVPAEDDTVDGLYNQVYRELLTLMMDDPENIDQASFLLWVAHNLERAADRVINICERVVFTVTGEMSEMDVDNGLQGGVESTN